MSAGPTAKSRTLDSVTTINRDGSRYFLHPADVRGRFTRARKIVAVFLLAVYVLLPWIKINGNPALFFDILHQRFHVFGLTLIPQDMWVLFFALTGLGFSLFFVTAVLGRLWCGWACPWTIFLEHLYRRVERWTDGDGPKRRKLREAPMSANKAIRRGIKWTLWLLISLALSHVFISYFLSIPQLWSWMRSGPTAHPFAFGVVAFLTVVLYWCFAWFREQFCIILCPYGRIQSALTDDDSMVVGYDPVRGEPRGKPSDPNNGDCVNCNRCVNVCPTGIDIRNGLQMECIGCAACVDACDEIMVKIGRPRGLVRYDSMNGLHGKKRTFIRPRLFMYAGLAGLGLAVFGVTMFLKAKPVHASIVRLDAAPFSMDESAVRNHFNMRVLNKRNQDVTFTLDLVDPPEGARIVGAEDGVLVEPQKEEMFPVVVVVPVDHYQEQAGIVIQVHADPGDTDVFLKTEFLGPAKRVIRRMIEEKESESGE